MSGPVGGRMGGAVALVTGAARGAGQAVALALGAAGARVAVVDVNPDGAQRVVDAIVQGGGAGAHGPGGCFQQDGGADHAL